MFNLPNLSGRHRLFAVRRLVPGLVLALAPVLGPAERAVPTAPRR